MPRTNVHQLNQAIGMLESGLTQRDVAERLQINQSSVSRAWRRYQNTGSVQYMHGGVPVRKTTARIDRYIIRQALNDRTITSKCIKNQLQEVNNLNISSKTVRNRLHAANLRSRRPYKHPQLQRQHRVSRMAFAEEHVNWGLHEWSRCLFADESRVALHPDDNRIRVWRRRGERFNENCSLDRIPFGGGSVTIWGGIFIGGRTELTLFVNRSVTAVRYLEVLENNIVQIAHRIGNDFIYVDDNAKPHRAAIVNQFFENNQLDRMLWPSRSPDCNPIEHIWDALKRRLYARGIPPRNIDELVVAIHEEWRLIPQEQIDNVILSMPRRCQELIRVQGGSTRY